MADDTESRGGTRRTVEGEADRLRKTLGASEETTFTIRQPLDDDDIEVAAITFTVPSSALLEKMNVAKATGRGRADPVYADNDDGSDGSRDGGPAHGGDRAQ
jgi:hypothetical protein